MCVNLDYKEQWFWNELLDLGTLVLEQVTILWNTGLERLTTLWNNKSGTHQYILEMRSTSLNVWNVISLRKQAFGAQQIYGTKLSFYTLYWNPDVPSVPSVLFLGDPISWPDSVGTWTKGTILPLAFLKN